MRRLRMTAGAITMASAALSHAGAQSAAPMIRGSVFDSLTRRAVPGALVGLSGSDLTVLSDRDGKFWLAAPAAGTYRLTSSAPSLDSLGLFGFTREVTLEGPGEHRMTLATPSFETMRARLCGPGASAPSAVNGTGRTPRVPAAPLPADSGIIFGTVRSASTRAGVGGATVRFTWFAVEANGTLAQRQRVAVTDANGDYGLCGIPSDLALLSRASSPALGSGEISTTIGRAGIMRRDLTVSEEMGATGDSAPPPRGNGVIRGTVRDGDGRPIAGALVLLESLDRSTRSSADGTFRFDAVPRGTQQVSARHIGYGIAQVVIDVFGERPALPSDGATTGRTRDILLALPKATVLATVNVRSTRAVGSDQMGFLQRKRQGFGSFLDEQEVGKRFDIASALQRVKGLVVQRSGMDFVVLSTRGLCVPLIVIDGMRLFNAVESGGVIPGSAMSGPSMNPRLGTLNPRDVLGVEFYPSFGMAPPLYVGFPPARDCGALLVWTTIARW